MQTGVDQANIAEAAIQNLSVSVSDAAQIASVIEATSEQQAIGVSQVSDAMSNINEAMREISNRAGRIRRSSRQAFQFGDKSAGTDSSVQSVSATHGRCDSSSKQKRKIHERAFYDVDLECG